MGVNVILHPAVQPLRDLSDHFAAVKVNQERFVSFRNVQVRKNCLNVFPHHMGTDAVQVTLVGFPAGGVMDVKDSLLVFQCKIKRSVKAVLQRRCSGVAGDDAVSFLPAGVAKFQGKYVMVFRNDFDHIPRGGFRGCVVGVAFSDDGKNWKVRETPFLSRESLGDPDVTRVYDPRLTVIDGRCFICFAVDTHHGLRGGIAVTDDFEKIEVLSLTEPDNRNMVLFPEKVGGRYIRLDRPMPVYSRGKDRFDLWLSRSPDLRYWGDHSLVLGVEDVPLAVPTNALSLHRFDHSTFFSTTGRAITCIW